MTTGVVVTLKVATSLDGRIALSNGISQWITGAKARARTHEMRAAHDGILVGVGTVLADDPLLTARTVPLPAKQPVRIVADSRLRTPRTSRLVQSAGTGRVVLAHGQSAQPFASGDIGAVDFWNVDDGHGRVSPLQLLRRARAEGLGSLFLEGGGQLAASFLKAGLVDRLLWFRAPIIIGGDGVPVVADLGFDTLDGLIRWRLEHSELLGEDVLESWALTRPA